MRSCHACFFGVFSFAKGRTELKICQPGDLDAADISFECMSGASAAKKTPKFEKSINRNVCTDECTDDVRSPHIDGVEVP
jgi:hypothetical protein